MDGDGKLRAKQLSSEEPTERRRVLSSREVFDSIFDPPSSSFSKFLSSQLIQSWRKRESDKKLLIANNKSPGNLSDSIEGESFGESNKDNVSIFEQEADSFSLTSSVHYGGQDIYSTSLNTFGPGSFRNVKKSDYKNENSSEFAFRGNWWQGSLYY